MNCSATKKLWDSHYGTTKRYAENKAFKGIYNKKVDFVNYDSLKQIAEVIQ